MKAGQPASLVSHACAFGPLVFELKGKQHNFAPLDKHRFNSLVMKTEVDQNFFERVTDHIALPPAVAQLRGSDLATRWLHPM
jgi:hypothetical protein